MPLFSCVATLFLPNTARDDSREQNWDVQEQVKAARSEVSAAGVPTWMDIDGGMRSDIYDSMAEGVNNAACVVCFMTQAYQVCRKTLLVSQLFCCKLPRQRLDRYRGDMASKNACARLPGLGQLRPRTEVCEANRCANCQCYDGSTRLEWPPVAGWWLARHNHCWQSVVSLQFLLPARGIVVLTPVCSIAGRRSLILPRSQRTFRTCSTKSSSPCRRIRIKTMSLR